jgi:hypothetical protein
VAVLRESGRRRAPCPQERLDLMHAVVQVLLSARLKEFRGGSGATERNRVREAEESPSLPSIPAKPSYLVHTAQHVFGSMSALGRLPGPARQVRPRPS